MGMLRAAQRGMFAKLNTRVLLLENRVSNLEQRSERSEWTGAFVRFDEIGDLPSGVEGQVAYVRSDGLGNGDTTIFLGDDNDDWRRFLIMDRTVQYNITKDATDRTFDAATVGIAELANVVATLITDIIGIRA